MNQVESFLSELEAVEKVVFEDCPDYYMFNLFPFVHLSYVDNLEEVLDELAVLKTEFSCCYIRSEGHVTVVMADINYKSKSFREMIVNILRKMRF